jgi:O-acetyl-ADP-ribose deacetylase (regulator of RNase III)
VITVVQGDIFESGADVLVDPVNCVGVSGKGLAKEFALRYGAAQRAYVQECRAGRMVPGRAFVSPTRSHPTVIFVATKSHWRAPSELEWIQLGVKNLAQAILDAEFKSVALPALGCGYGALDWEVVRPVIEQGLGDLNSRILLYEPV